MTIRLLTMIRIKTSMEKSIIDFNCTKKCHTTNSIINQQQGERDRRERGRGREGEGEMQIEGER